FTIRAAGNLDLNLAAERDAEYRLGWDRVNYGDMKTKQRRRREADRRGVFHVEGQNRHRGVPPRPPPAAAAPRNNASTPPTTPATARLRPKALASSSEPTPPA